MKSFDLRIQFAGLMLWVPEGPGRMHVLMPMHQGHGTPGGPAPHPGHETDAEHDKHRHHGRLMYDVAYESPTSQQLSRTLRAVNIERRLLKLDGLSAAGIDLDLPDEIPHMRTVARSVERHLVERFPGGPVMGRITMDAGALTGCDMGARYSLGGQALRMGTRTEWTIRGIEADSIDLASLVYQENGSKLDLPRLYPIGQTVSITVYNTLAGDMPQNGKRGPYSEEDAIHFDAYYDLCPPLKDRKIPRHAGAEIIQVLGDAVEARVDQSGGLTCVHAQSHLAEAAL